MRALSYIFLTALFVLAVFFRLYQSSNFFMVTSETAQHYLEIIKLFDKETFFLHGPLTSHPWLRLSALPYYLFFPIMQLHAFHPLTLVYYSLFSSVITVFLNYLVVKSIFGNKTAFISTFFLAIAPSHLIYSRLSGFFVFVIPLTYLLIWLTSKLTQSKKQPVWPIFAVIGFLITLHASALFLLFFFSAIFIYQKRLTLRKSFVCVLAFLLPNIPFFTQDSLQEFSMTKNLLLWIPYKFITFLSGKTFGVERQLVTNESLSNIINFINTSFFPPQYPWYLGAIMLVLLIFLFLKKKPSALEKILYLWLFFGLAVLLIHQNPPFHYFATILILPIILISKWLADISPKIYHQTILTILLLVIGLSEIHFIFSPAFLYQDPKHDTRFVPYASQLRIAQRIKNDVGDKQFWVHRIGPFDNYPQESKEQYLYLLWWLGNQPVETAPLTYTIIENTPQAPIDSTMILLDEIDGVKILKQE